MRYEGVLNGAFTFEQVDPAGRGFVALLAGGFIRWTDAAGNVTDCQLDPLRIWATAGSFQ